MKKIIIALFLLTLAAPAAFAGDKAFDVEEYATLDDLASAIALRVQGALGEGRQGSLPPKIKLAVIPVAPKRSALAREIGERLAKTGSFDVLDADTTATFMEGRKPSGAGLVKELARAHNLDAVAAIRIYPSDGKMMVITRIFSGRDAQPPDTIAALLDAGPGGAPVGSPAQPAAPVKQTSEGYPELPVAARYAVAADLSGDGKQEYVFSDGEHLSVYRLESSGWRRVWAEPAESGSRGVRHLYLDVADVNGNGKPEIFVTILRGGREVSSEVYEEQNGTFRRIAVLPGFVRVLNYPGRGPILIGQESREDRFFAGTPKQYTWSGGQYVAGADFHLPKEVNIYGFVYADFGESHPLLVALDDKDHLRVYSRDTLIWESQERYGAVETIAVESVPDAYNVGLKVGIKGGIVAMDIDGDGKDEIIVPKYGRAAVFTQVKESEIQGLTWTGARLEPQIVINNVPGAVLDVHAARLTSGGVQLLSLIQTPGGIFTKPGVKLITYSLK